MNSFDNSSPSDSLVPVSTGTGNSANSSTPSWLEQIRAIGSVVCGKLNYQEDRILNTELIGQDTSKIIHNRIVPWAHSVNDRLSSLYDGLSLIYLNLPSHLDSFRMDLDSLGLHLKDAVDSQLQLQNYVRTSLPQEIYDSFHQDTLTLIDNRTSDIFLQLSSFEQRLPAFLTLKSDFTMFMEETRLAIQAVKGDIEDLQFAEPHNTPLQESSPEDKIKTLVDQKFGEFQTLLEQKIQIITDMVNHSQPSQIPTPASDTFIQKLNEDVILIEKKISLLESRFEKLERLNCIAKLKKTKTKLKKEIQDLKSEVSKINEKLDCDMPQLPSFISLNTKLLFLEEERVKEKAAQEETQKIHQLLEEFKKLKLIFDSQQMEFLNLKNKISEEYSKLRKFNYSEHTPKDDTIDKIPFGDLIREGEPQIEETFQATQKYSPSILTTNHKEWKNMPKNKFFRRKYPRTAKLIIYVQKDWSTRAKAKFIREEVNNFLNSGRSHHCSCSRI